MRCWEERNSVVSLCRMAVKKSFCVIQCRRRPFLLIKATLDVAWHVPLVLIDPM